MKNCIIVSTDKKKNIWPTSTFLHDKDFQQTSDGRGPLSSNKTRANITLNDERWMVSH